MASPGSKRGIRLISTNTPERLRLRRFAPRTRTPKLWVESHRVISATLAAEPAVYALCHWVKFVPASAIGTADDPLKAVWHQRAEGHPFRIATSDTTTRRIRCAGFRAVSRIDSVARANFTT
jgi:hypothetical protein